MPALLNYECDVCNFVFSKAYGGPYFYVKIDEEDVLLPHPAESSVALKLTGKTIPELEKEGLAVVKDDRICLNCLKFEKNCLCSPAELIEIPKLKDMDCPRCKKGTVKTSLHSFS